MLCQRVLRLTIHSVKSCCKAEGKNPVEHSKGLFTYTTDLALQAPSLANIIYDASMASPGEKTGSDLIQLSMG